MIKIIKGINDKDGFEEEVNNFMCQYNSKLLDIKCIYRENARQFIYIAIIEYKDDTKYICVPVQEYTELKEKSWMYEELCKWK